jgi:hypothetical protein
MLNIDLFVRSVTFINYRYNLKTSLNKAFPVNVWGLSTLLGSLLFLFILISKFLVKEPDELFAALSLLVLFAAVFSLPTFLICYFAIKYFSKKGMPIKNIRIWVYFTALITILLTATFLLPDVFKERILLIGLTCYITGFTISFFLLKINL